jgi:hypothetical protein
MNNFVQNGYRYMPCKNHPNASKKGCVLEHRLVMEQFLGRYLMPDEVIHHKNGNRLDNRLENLELLSSDSEHMKLHLPKTLDYLDSIRDYIIKKYNQGYGSVMIARELNCSRNSILHWMELRGIPKRSPKTKTICKEGYKWCNVCKAEIPISEFYINKNTYDGLRNRCKECTIKEAIEGQKRRSKKICLK